MPTFTLSNRSAWSAVEFPTSEIAFGRDGAPTDPSDVAAVKKEFEAAGVTDLLVLCGGWSDGEAEFRSLYDSLTKSFRSSSRGDPAYSAHTYGILRVLWPSRRWPEDDPALGAAQLSAEDLAYRKIAVLEREVTSLRGAFGGMQADRHLLKVWQLISSAAESVPAQVSLVEHIRELVRAGDELDPSPKPDEYASPRFLAMHPLRLLEAVSGAEATRRDREDFSAAGSTADDCLTIPGDEPAQCDIHEGIHNLLRYVTAHAMRVRSEAVGRTGLYDALLQLSHGLRQTRLHLVGHSFGARAILSATAGPKAGAPLIRPKTLTILQGALPENALAPARGDEAEGFYHSVLAEGKVGGPILVTHSIADETAGVPYAIAERIATYSQPGKLAYPDVVCTMARSGATESGALQGTLSAHPRGRWRRGTLVNLNGDGVINSHLDVCKPEVTASILSAATTPA